MSRDVAALSGGSAQVVSALSSLLFMSVGSEMQLEMDDSAHGALVMQHPLHRCQNR